MYISYINLTTKGKMGWPHFQRKGPIAFHRQQMPFQRKHLKDVKSEVERLKTMNQMKKLYIYIIALYSHSRVTYHNLSTSTHLASYHVPPLSPA